MIRRTEEKVEFRIRVRGLGDRSRVRGFGGQGDGLTRSAA